MLIDILVAVVLLGAIINGFRKGLILAVFSVVGLLVGLAAALKLSAVTANYLSGTVNLSAKWLPILSFVVVFLAAVLIVRLIASVIQKTMEMAMLGWVNRIGGMVAYAIIYLLVLSVAFFYLDKIHALSASAIAESKTYSFIQPLGPKVIDLIGRLLPSFKNVFHELTQFFENLSKKPHSGQ